MTPLSDADAVLAHLRTAAHPLTDAAQLFVDPDGLSCDLTLEDSEIIGQAILTSLLSLNMALEGLVTLIEARKPAGQEPQ